jgi:hypothetical protein
VLVVLSPVAGSGTVDPSDIGLEVSGAMGARLESGDIGVESEVNPAVEAIEGLGEDGTSAGPGNGAVWCTGGGIGAGS